MGALVVAGCSTGQATPLTTKHSAILVTTQGAATPSDRGTLTGEVCRPLNGPLETKVIVSLDKSVPGVGRGPQVRSETVPQNGRYRFTSVVAGLYVLVGQWPNSPLFRTSAWVSAHQTSVVNLGTCVPTIGVDYRPASVAAVRRFLAEATAGGGRAFSATYRYLGGEIYSSDASSPPFFFAQRPHGRGGSVQPWGAGDFAYLAQQGTKSFKWVQVHAHDYECLRNKPSAPWSCSGPNPETIMNALATLSYDVPAGLLRDIPPPSKDVFVSSATLSGLKVTCLRFPAPDGSLATWCITADGITAFAAASNLANLEVVTLSPILPADIFSLPASPRKWHGFIYWPT